METTGSKIETESSVTGKEDQPQEQQQREQEVESLKSEASEKMGSAVESGKEQMSHLMEQAKGAAQNVQEGAGHVLEQVREKGSELLEKVAGPDVSKKLSMENAGEAVEQTKNMAKKTLGYISDLAAATKEKLSISAEKAKTSTTSFLDSLQEGLNQITDTAGQLGQRVQEKTGDPSQKIDKDFGIAGEKAEALSAAGEHFERSD